MIYLMLCIEEWKSDHNFILSLIQKHLISIEDLTSNKKKSVTV